MKLFHGNFVYAPNPTELKILQDGYIVVDENGIIQLTTHQIPEEYKACKMEDFGMALVVPGFVDLHLHSSQLPICGLGCDGEEDWFGQYCYPAEKRCADPEYAHRIHKALIREIRRHGITRACIMCTTDSKEAKDLFDQYLVSGLSARIGKMNSDQGAFGVALEQTESSIEETLDFLKSTQGKSELVKPALCPEFAPACSAQMMEFLGRLAKEKQLLIHSHMSEGEADVKLVQEKFPEEGNYGKVYDRYGLLGYESEKGDRKISVMAHCLNNSPEEIALMAKRGTVAVHCPMAALDSGSEFLFSARTYLDAGVTVGLGSDVGGGHTLNMMQSMVAALQLSKQVSREMPLTIPEVFHMATKGGGKAFGKIGSFEEGYEFDALVIDDSRRSALMNYSLEERLAQFIYCGEPSEIEKCYCRGVQV